MKNKAYYFSHDGNAHNDVKIQYLIADLGMEGYGIFWYIIEKLFDAGGILPIRIVKILAKQMSVSEAKVKAVIEAYGLFVLTDESFYSQRLMLHFTMKKTLSDSGKNGAKIRWGGHREANGEANGEAIDTLIARKEKKKEEKKREENIDIDKCLEEAKKDFRWTFKAQATDPELDAFNEHLTLQGIHHKESIMDYKKHFVNWKAKKPEILTKIKIQNRDDSW